MTAGERPSGTFGVTAETFPSLSIFAESVTEPAAFGSFFSPSWKHALNFGRRPAMTLSGPTTDGVVISLLTAVTGAVVTSPDAGAVPDAAGGGGDAAGAGAEVEVAGCAASPRSGTDVGAGPELVVTGAGVVDGSDAGVEGPHAATATASKQTMRRFMGCTIHSFA